MKRFGSLMLAAVLGSVMTIVASQWLVKDNQHQGVKIEHISGVPASQVAYRVNEQGEAVPLDFTVVAEKATQAVVHIRSSQLRTARNNSQIPEQFRQFFGPYENQGPRQSTGSGVIISKDGYIVTNNHVVEGADDLLVTLSDNRELKAEVVGTDPDTDLAVIKINEKDLAYLSFVNSDNAKVGEWVLAVGNPFNLNSTVTAGIISAKGRSINIIGSNNSSGAEGDTRFSTAIESFIQTDAAINPGNSGGALVNLSGGLIGINTAIASPTGSYSGYGFAVPANIVSKIAEDLIGHGIVQRGWLGINLGSVNSQMAKEYDLTVKEGAYVGGFGDNPSMSAAKAAGILEGDVIVKADETVIKSGSALITYVGLKRPGDKINVTINRKGKTLTIPIVLRSRAGKTAAIAREEKREAASLGVDLEEVDGKVLKRLDLAGGAKVADLKDGKIARSTDMREGFIITHVDDVVVKSVKDVEEIIKKKKSGDLITIAGVYEDYPREYIYALRM